MSGLRLLLLGPPGAGKGTQAALLVERLGVPQIATGDMLRAAVAAGTEVGRSAKEFMDRGELVPDAVVIQVAAERLGQPDAARGFVLDGFPRNLDQAKALDELVGRLDGCIVICVAEDLLIERLLKRAEIEGRGDDDEETIRRRMSVYRQQTQPLIDYYRTEGILAEVDGVGSVEEVARRIGEALAT